MRIFSNRIAFEHVCAVMTDMTVPGEGIPMVEGTQTVWYIP